MPLRNSETRRREVENETRSSNCKTETWSSKCTETWSSKCTETWSSKSKSAARSGEPGSARWAQHAALDARALTDDAHPVQLTCRAGSCAIAQRQSGQIPVQFA